MRSLPYTLLGTILLSFAVGCSQPKTEMPDDPAPPPAEAPGAISGESTDDA
ncbi:MAG: hypothetical protein JXB62_22825 [Pirellulales bacterium]|nr:hypothetical protein [Pirellulales bacterium]